MLLGSCHGVLCVANVADGQVALWSPTTGDCNPLLPADAKIDHMGPTVCVYGFGYDSDKNEHVLLRLVETLLSPVVSAVSIYRSSAGGWRWLQRILPYYLVDSGRMGVYADGDLYWIMRREWEQNSAKVLVCFDIYNTCFDEASLPNDIDVTCRMDLTVLGKRKRLCLIIYGEPGVVDVWINNPLLSWSRLFSLREQWPSFQTVWPLPLSKDHRQVLMEVGNEIKTIELYDVRTREAQQFHINNMPTFFDATRLAQNEQQLVWCITDRQEGDGFL